MKRINNDATLANLPPPISLTVEQLAQVASDTGATLGAGGGLSSLVIAGGLPIIPIVTVVGLIAAAGAAMK
jgi:hypothetical protein